MQYRAEEEEGSHMREPGRQTTCQPDYREGLTSQQVRVYKVMMDGRMWR